MPARRDSRTGDSFEGGSVHTEDRYNRPREVGRTEGQLRCFVWVQGEYERRLWIKENAAGRVDLMADYKRLFKEMLDGVRTASSTPNARAVIVQLSPSNVSSTLGLPESDPTLVEDDVLHRTAFDKQTATGTTAFRKMQAELVSEIPGAVLVSTDGLPKRSVADPIHYNAEGTKALGERIYDACY